MQDRRSLNTLKYQHEAVKARLEIREFYLNMIIKSIYEEIGQVLCLIHLQLSSLADKNHKIIEQDINQSDQLLVNTIKELRMMGKSLFPDQSLLNETKWLETLQEAILLVHPKSDFVIRSKGIAQVIDLDLKMILFR